MVIYENFCTALEPINTTPIGVILPGIILVGSLLVLFAMSLAQMQRSIRAYRSGHGYKYTPYLRLVDIQWRWAIIDARPGQPEPERIKVFYDTVDPRGIKLGRLWNQVGLQKNHCQIGGVSTVCFSENNIMAKMIDQGYVIETHEDGKVYMTGLDPLYVISNSMLITNKGKNINTEILQKQRGPVEIISNNTEEELHVTEVDPIQVFYPDEEEIFLFLLA